MFSKTARVLARSSLASVKPATERARHRLDEAEAAVKRWQRDDVGHTVYLYLNGLDKVL